MALTLSVNLKQLLVAIDRNTAAIAAQSDLQAGKLDAIARAIANLSDAPPGRFIITVQEQD